MNFKKYISSAIILSCSFFIYGCENNNIYNQNNEETNNMTNTSNENEVTISAVGDVMVHKKQLIAQKDIDNKYNFDNNFRLLKKYIEESDLSIANLETTINPSKKVSSYPSFNSPPEILDALKNAGFDVISTINNHSLDSGEKGIQTTIDEITKRKLEYVGTQKDKEDKNYIIQEVKGIKIGISSFSYADEIDNKTYLNGIPSKKSKSLLNTIDKTDANKSFKKIKKEIDYMKEENCDFIILNIHWGEEYKQTPSKYQKTLAKLLINEGVDIIFGSHPHVVQPIETITSDDKTHTGTVFYSLGNIISNQQEEEMGFNMSENGLVPIVNIEKIENDTIIKNIEYIPTWVYRKPLDNEKKYEYTIIPLEGNLEEISKKEKINLNDLKTSFNNTKDVINNKDTTVFNGF